jgi:hypothetical protein
MVLSKQQVPQTGWMQSQLQPGRGRGAPGIAFCPCREFNAINITSLQKYQSMIKQNDLCDQDLAQTDFTTYILLKKKITILNNK